MDSGDQELVSADLFEQYASNFSPEDRRKIAQAIRVHGEVPKDDPVFPFANRFVEALVQDPTTSSQEARQLGQLLKRYPQLPIDTTVDLGSGNLIALPIDYICKRLQEKIKLAIAMQDQTGVDIDAQGRNVAGKCESVLKELDAASKAEGIDMRAHIYKTLQGKDAGIPEISGTGAGPWWETFIPNYLTGMKLEQIAQSKLAQTAKTN